MGEGLFLEGLQGPPRGGRQEQADSLRASYRCNLLLGGTEDFCSQRSLCGGQSGAVGLEVLVLSEGNLKSELLHTLVLNTAAH